MKSIEELQSELRAICAELDKIKEAQKAETPETNFKEIAAKASRYPIAGHPMSGEDEHTKDMYMLLLMSVIVLDPDKYTESFMTFYRIAAGMGYNGNSEELMLKAQTMKFETLDECTRVFNKDDKKLMLLLECMLIAGQFDKGRRKAMEYIAELASLLNINKEQITFLTNLARVILAQDLKAYKTDVLNTYGKLFDCYIDVFESQFEYYPLEASLCCECNIDNHRHIGIIKIIRYEKDKITVSYDADNLISESYASRHTKYIIDDYIINTKGKVIDYIFTNTRFFADDYYSLGDEWCRIYRQKVFSKMPMYPFGIASNHPLAHSKAVNKYFHELSHNHISAITKMYDDVKYDYIDEAEQEQVLNRFLVE